eukprot:9479112-Pyramimonas_sp.AAC.1
MPRTSTSALPRPGPLLWPRGSVGGERVGPSCNAVRSSRARPRRPRSASAPSSTPGGESGRTSTTSAPTTTVSTAPSAPGCSGGSSASASCADGLTICSSEPRLLAPSLFAVGAVFRSRVNASGGLRVVSGFCPPPRGLELKGARPWGLGL